MHHFEDYSQDKLNICNSIILIQLFENYCIILLQQGSIGAFLSFWWNLRKKSYMIIYIEVQAQILFIGNSGMSGYRSMSYMWYVSQVSPKTVHILFTFTILFTVIILKQLYIHILKFTKNYRYIIITIYIDTIF